MEGRGRRRARVQRRGTNVNTSADVPFSTVIHNNNTKKERAQDGPEALPRGPRVLAPFLRFFSSWTFVYTCAHPCREKVR